LNRIPEYQDQLDPVDSPEKFYDDLVARYRSLRTPPEGKIVLYMVPPYADHEDERLKKLFSSRGVDVVTPYTKKRLVSNNRGVFIEEKRPNGSIRRSPVGYLVLNGEHAFFDSKNPATYERALIEEAAAHLAEQDLASAARKRIEAALKANLRTGKIDLPRLDRALKASTFLNSLDHSRSQAKGLLNAIMAGKVATNYSPGVNFVGDKEFYVYVDDLVRHYLHEEPILKNIPTERFGKLGPNGKIEVDRDLLDRVFGNPEKYVVKAVDGRGGDSVWVGAKISPEEFASVRRKILAEPERFIVQGFTHLSVMDRLITDIRMISAVDPAGVLVSPTPWGRALPIDGNGKVNLSATGREVAVMITRSAAANTPGRCIRKNLARELGAPAHP
jgi:hypothetical protein